MAKVRVFNCGEASNERLRDVSVINTEDIGACVNGTGRWIEIDTASLMDYQVNGKDFGDLLAIVCLMFCMAWGIRFISDHLRNR